MRVAKLQELARQRLPQHVINFASLEEGLATLSLDDAIKPAAVQEILARTPDVIHTYVPDDPESYSEYRITYKGGKAFVAGVTPTQEAAVRERLEELGLTDYEIALIKREKPRKAWRRETRRESRGRDAMPGAMRHESILWQRRRR